MINFNFLERNKKIILSIFTISLLAEMVSLVSFNFPLLNSIIFFTLLVLFIFLATYKLEWGMYFILFEVFLNSMGYIFYYENGDFKVSIRIAIWLLFMAIFLSKILIKKIKIKEIFDKIKFNKAFLILGGFIILGLLVGLKNNVFGDVFSDFNSFLFFLLILPFSYILNREGSKKIWENIVLIFISIAIYISFKSLLFLFLFSHDLRPIISDLYSWSRLYLLGEITRMDNDFYRMFFQNQIFIILASIFSLTALFFNKNKEKIVSLIILNSIFLSVIIISFSRSFWLGLLLSSFCLIAFSFYKLKTKKTLFNILKTLIVFVLSISLIFLIIKFPWPKVENNFNTRNISERAKVKTEESAVSSRWALLAVMKNEIKDNILSGAGFGYRLEYKSSDPRVLENNADGMYSTYVFEWSWLDFLLKTGIFGFLSYVFLMFLILRESFLSFLRKKNYAFLAILLSIIAISAVNFFTPYLNHPLGIIYLIILILLLDYDKNNSHPNNAG
jgi:hypothetical protein